ncbi:hypothetical protein E2C01_056101 [Portunus trituberculatus]|uniref:Uncharacterized protein n=1 Tax=Portunus trituberculatus TaxID=210409 RepID=A0A5B7GT67_PORTR|nr:hypothetical protein [Portunus trituberculatus]
MLRSMGPAGESASLSSMPPGEQEWYRLAGKRHRKTGDHRRLQELIPLVLQYNGLPAVYIPESDLSANTRTNTRLSRRGHPGAVGKTEDSTVAAPNHQQAATAAEAEPTGDKPGNRKGMHDDVLGEDEDEDEEDEDEEDEDEDEEEDDEEDNEEVDVLGSESEGEAPSPQPSKPNRPSDPQPPSGKQEEDDGWAERKTTPSIALRELPTITKLRQEKRTGKILEDVPTGVYIHEENLFVGNVKGYTGFSGYMSYPYPKDSSTPVK